MREELSIPNIHLDKSLIWNECFIGLFLYPHQQVFGHPYRDRLTRGHKIRQSDSAKIRSLQIVRCIKRLPILSLLAFIFVFWYVQLLFHREVSQIKLSFIFVCDASHIV